MRQSSSSVCSTEDREDPSCQSVVHRFLSSLFQLTENYAIVGRFWDATTGQLLVIAAGISIHGTISAGEFLTDKRFLQEVIAQDRGGSATRTSRQSIQPSSSTANPAPLASPPLISGNPPEPHPVIALPKRLFLRISLGKLGGSGSMMGVSQDYVFQIPRRPGPTKLTNYIPHPLTAGLDVRH